MIIIKFSTSYWRRRNLLKIALGLCTSKALLTDLVHKFMHLFIFKYLVISFGQCTRRVVYRTFFGWSKTRLRLVLDHPKTFYNPLITRLGARLIFKSFTSLQVFIFQYLLFSNLTLPPFSMYDYMNVFMFIKGNITILALIIMD